VEIVGIKLGAEGAFVKTANTEQVHIIPFTVKAVDTTGAGDGWNAGLLFGVLKEWDLKTCVTVANAVGALVVTKHGAITALPYKEDLKVFLRANNSYIEI
jgi:sugar/nucleoside kinase (ribokinase family)